MSGAPTPVALRHLKTNPNLDSQAWWMLAILTLAYIVSAIDRQIISLLVEPIKADLSLTDTQLSILIGFGFILVYAVSAIPAGFMVDRVKRTSLVSGALTLWSGMTGLSGLAQNFATMFVARAGVAVGEAVLTPAAYSLMADSFPRHRQALVFGIYSCGAVVGAASAYLFGGMLYTALAAQGTLELFFITLAPWQTTFILLMLPGLILAAVLFVMQEPARVTQSAEAAGSLAGGGAGRTLRAFYSTNRTTLIFHHLAVGMTFIVTNANATWMAAFFIRSYELPIRETGFWLAASSVVGGLIGLIGGGALSDYLLRYGAHVRLWLSAAVCCAGSLSAVAAAISPTPAAAAIFYTVEVVCITMPFAIANVSLQRLVPGEIRGTVTALYFLTTSVIGSIGPTLVALIGDQLFPSRDGLRYSLSITVAIAFVFGAISFMLTIKPYRRSLARVEATEGGSCLAAADKDHEINSGDGLWRKVTKEGKV